MATSDLLAGTVMDAAAAALNDTAKTVYTYEAQIPYLNMALRELQEHFQLNDVPVVDTITTDPIDIPADITKIAFNASPNPELPDDLIEPTRLWVSPDGQSSFTPLTRAVRLPQQLRGIQTNFINEFVWQSQEIRFLPANADNDVMIEYIRNLFQPAVDEDSPINVINALTFLSYRTAALCAAFIGEDETRAGALTEFAVLGIDRATGITTKGNQGMIVRRQPFRASWKMGRRIG